MVIWIVTHSNCTNGCCLHGDIMRISTFTWCPTVCAFNHLMLWAWICCCKNGGGRGGGGGPLKWPLRMPLQSSLLMKIGCCQHWAKMIVPHSSLLKGRWTSHTRRSCRDTTVSKQRRLNMQKWVLYWYDPWGTHSLWMNRLHDRTPPPKGPTPSAPTNTHKQFYKAILAFWQWHCPRCLFLPGGHEHKHRTNLQTPWGEVTSLQESGGRVLTLTLHKGSRSQMAEWWSPNQS